MENFLYEILGPEPPLRGGPNRSDVIVDCVRGCATLFDLEGVLEIVARGTVVEKALRRDDKGVWCGIMTARRLCDIEGSA